MQKTFLLALGAWLAMTSLGYGESSWDKLIKEIDTPVMGKKPQNSPQGNAATLSMPEGFEPHQEAGQDQKGDDARVKVVTSYKCHNPSLPRCLIYLDDPDRVDVANCKEVSKSYIRDVAAYSRCVDRQARKHARRVVEYFNCTVKGRSNCGFVYD